MNITKAFFIHQITVTPDHPSAGQNATLTCETAPSNPPSVITWWRNGERIDSATEGANVETVTAPDAPTGGRVTSSRLSLALTPTHNGAVVTCEAANAEVAVRVHDAVTLSVSREYRFIRTEPFYIIK